MIYLTEGNIPLNAAYDDNITQEANSIYQLTFKFPTNNILWQRLREETFLIADDLHGEQDFVIFEVEKKLGYIQVYANQVMTMLNHYVVNPMSLDRQTGSTALSQFAGSITRENPFSFFSDIEDRHTFNTDSVNAMAALTKDKHSILGQWGGDLVRHGYQVRLLKNGGSENESLFMYKKNLSSYQHKTSTKSLKTRITFIATVKGEGEKAPDRKLSVVVDSPLINKYSQIYEDVVEVNDQDVKDEATLRKYGEQYFRTSLCDLMEDSIEIDVIGQSDVPVQMFDVVGVYHELYGLDVRKKITKYTYSPMAKKLKSIGFGQFQSGLASAIGNVVSDAFKSENQHFQSNFERQLVRELKNADLAFERKKEELTNQFTDEVNAIKAKSEENKRALSDEIDRRFHEFSPAGFEEAKSKAEEALKKAGASYNLAEEAKYIASVNDIALGGLADKFNKQSGKLDNAITTQTALSGDLGALKRTVSSEVNQASEHRRTTTEALSRMTGQMNGFATKSEVKQDVTGLTETFAKLKTDTNDLISGAKSEITAAKTEFNKTADGLSAKMSAVESYVGQDGQRQEALKRYAREETANQTSAIRETISRDYVAKSTYLENVEGTNQRFETLKRENELKLAEYKQGIDGRFTNLSSQIAGKVNQTDFQRVRETSQLYERIFGGAENDVPNNISRMVMSNQIFQTEVGKYSIAGGPNLLRNSRADDGLKYWNGDQSKFKFLSHNFYLKGQKQMFLLENGAVVNSPRFIFKRNTDYIFNLIAFDGNTERVRITLRKRKKDSSNPDYDEVQTIFDKTGSPAFNSDRTVKRSFKFNTGDFDNGYLLFQYFGRPNVWSGMFMTELDFYEGSNDRKWQPAPEDSAEPIEAVRTQVTQLAGSYAIQNLNSAGDIINGINLGANGNNRIIGKATHITGDTLIDNAVIKSAMIDKLKTANFEAGSVTTNILGAEAVTAEKVKFDTAFIQRLVSQQAFINELFAKQATITKIQSIDFTGNHIKGGKISSLNGVTDFDLQTGWIDMNKEAVGIRNRFDGKPMQFLIFGQGSINGVPSAYTQLMSNRNGQTGIEHTSAGIQIWNGRLGDNIQTAITFYGKSMDFIPNSQGGGVSLNTETRDFKGLNNITATGNISTSGMITANNIFLSGYGNNNLKALFNDIYKNLALLHKNKETKNNYTYSMYGPID